MAQKTAIQWTDYTSNPIRARHKVTGKVGHACIKVSDGCKNCYAERMNRWRGTGEPFTPAGMANVELFMDDAEMRKLETFKPRGPFKAGGTRAMVFPFDMTDLFQDAVPSSWIQRFFNVVEKRRNIIWQVLTKRPARAYLELRAFGRKLPNLWLGTSIENQDVEHFRTYDLREIHDLVGLLFLSIEPLLGPVNLGCDLIGMSWVIVGGESGCGARECQIDWVRLIRDRCLVTGVAFFMKQVGRSILSTVKEDFGHPDNRFFDAPLQLYRYRVADSHGGNPEEWPEDLRVREWPKVTSAA